MNSSRPHNLRIEYYTVDTPTALDFGATRECHFVDAPFLPCQVESLNAYQNSGEGHPFTCCRDRKDAAHCAYQAKHGGDFGQLIATEDGWVCPVEECDYVQDFAWLRMADWSWQEST